MDKSELKHANEITKDVKAEDQAVVDAVCTLHLSQSFCRVFLGSFFLIFIILG